VTGGFYRFYPCGNTIEFKPADRMIPFRSFKHHKVKALELAGDANGIVFATDDENFGSSITFPKTTNKVLNSLTDKDSYSFQ